MATRQTFLIYASLIYLVVLIGWYVASYGPLIPHFSEATGQDQTHYSYLFLVRSTANIASGIISKWMLNAFPMKYLIRINMITILVTLFISTLSITFINLTITLFFASICVLSTIIILYGATFKLFKNDKPDFWIQLIGCFFGVGAFMGPYLIMLFKLETFKILGILFALYPLPQISENSNAKQSVSGLIIGKRSQLYICLVMFCYSTCQLGFASWIPTYSIKAGISNVQDSGFYSMMFWLPNCIFRLVWMYIPGSVYERLRWSWLLLFISTSFLVFFQYLGWYRFVAIFGPVTAGMFIAGVYAFCISLPVDSGFTPTNQNNANFVMANCLGQGLLIMPIGYSMEIFGFRSLIVEVFIVSALGFWALGFAKQSMQKDKIQNQQRLLIRRQSKQQDN